MTNGRGSGGPWQGDGAYHAWAEFLQRWARARQDATLPAPGTLPSLSRADLPGDAWERLGNRLTEAMSQRLQGVADALARALSEATDEFEAGRALTHSRAGLRDVRALAAHPALPQELRGRLTHMIDEQIRHLQGQLEAQLDRSPAWRADPRRAEARRRTLRDNALTAILAQPPAPPPLTEGHGWAFDPAGRARRRIMTNPDT
jgi:hypothetical protein